MYKALSPGAIGVRANSLADAVAAAKKYGFGGVEFNPSEVADIIERDGVDAAKAAFDGLKPAGFGLSVDWRGSDENWQKGLESLPRQAKAASAIGCDRCMTWVLSCSNEREFAANFQFHVERFTPIAQILHDNGCRLGLEFLGPKTLRESQQHLFIYTMKGMLELGAAIGPNVGLLLDCWHWHTSGGTLDDLHTLTPEKVVYVHVNDAPKNVLMDEYVDNVRGLPGETGVIDIANFLRVLQTIGYDGPITAEPFKKELNDLPNDDERLRVVAASLDFIFKYLS